jgi:hypothetical protein
MKRKALTFPIFYGKTLNLDLIVATIDRSVRANAGRGAVVWPTTNEA